MSKRGELLLLCLWLLRALLVALVSRTAWLINDICYQMGRQNLQHRLFATSNGVMLNYAGNACDAGDLVISQCLFCVWKYGNKCSSVLLCTLNWFAACCCCFLRTSLCTDFQLSKTSKMMSRIHNKTSTACLWCYCGVIDCAHARSDCPRKMLLTVRLCMVWHIARNVIVRARARAIVPE